MGRAVPEKLLLCRPLVNRAQGPGPTHRAISGAGTVVTSTPPPRQDAPSLARVQARPAQRLRLPWFRKGWMPDDPRLRLIADLVPEARKAAREAIEQILYSTSSRLRTPRPTGRWCCISRPPAGGDATGGPRGSATRGSRARRDLHPLDGGRQRVPAGLGAGSSAVSSARPTGRELLDGRTLAGGLLASLLALLVWWQAASYLKPAFDQILKEPREIETFQECPSCPEMVVIPAGSFMMGSPTGDPLCPPLRHRPKRGDLRRFDEWDACVADKGCAGYNPSDSGWGRGRRPVINVDWNLAQAYLRWLSDRTGSSYRLPSEAEWEYTNTSWSCLRGRWGNAVSTQLANFATRSTSTSEAGSYPPGPSGLHDTSGDVWELVEDCWNESYEGAPDDGSAWASGAAAGCCAGAPGTTVRSTSVRPSASGTTPASGTTTSVSGLPGRSAESGAYPLNPRSLTPCELGRSSEAPAFPPLFAPEAPATDVMGWVTAGDQRATDRDRRNRSPLDQRSPRRITLPSAATGQHSSCPKNIVPQSRGGGSVPMAPQGVRTKPELPAARAGDIEGPFLPGTAVTFTQGTAITRKRSNGHAFRKARPFFFSPLTCDVGGGRGQRSQAQRRRQR